jgi:troponin T
MQETQNKAKGPNFTITKKEPGVSLSSAQLERNKTKEQIEEEKRISLSFRIKPLNIEGFSIQKLQSKARELWDTIVKLETEKYDLEERQKRQDYDVSVNIRR